MTRSFSFFVLVILFIFGTLFQAPAQVPKPASSDDYVWLKVKGKQIVTSAESEGGEKPFIPVGIGYCRDVIIKAQDDAVMKFCKERSLNTVRLSCYTLFFNGKKDRPIDIEEHIQNHIVPVVEAAKKAGMYVIIDAHEYLSEEIDEATARETQKGRGWDEPALQKWMAAWVAIARKFKDEPHVLGYELVNEPHDIPAEEARDKYTRCLKAIREVDTRHIVIVGNHAWSHSRGMEKTWGAVASTVDAPYNQVVFAFHDYPEDDQPWKVRDNVVRFRDQYQVPVLCTEFGATHWNKSETQCRTFLAGVHALFAREDIGWMIWALKTLEDHPRSPYNEVDKTGLGPPKVYDSCPYSDLWVPNARIMASPFPKPAAPGNAKG